MFASVVQNIALFTAWRVLGAAVVGASASAPFGLSPQLVAEAKSQLMTDCGDACVAVIKHHHPVYTCELSCHVWAGHRC